MNSKLEFSGKVIAIDITYADKITIAIFIKLLAMRIVAKSRFGFCNNPITSKCFLSFSISSISDGLNEKNATSAPEINAEQTSRRNTINKQENTLILNRCNSTSLNMDSNIETGTSSKLVII